MGGGVHQAAAVNVHEEAEVTEEISTEDGVCDIRDDEHPTEGAAQAQVQGEGTFTKCRDSRAVDCLEGNACRGTGTGQVRGRRNDTHLRSSVH